MSFGPDDSGILEFKTEKEAEAYLDELGPKFKYGCYRRGDPVQCHSLARWYASYKREYPKALEVFQQNCFKNKFSDSCIGYAFYKIFGSPGIKRNANEAFEAFQFGCNEMKDNKCCQAAGELLLEGSLEMDKRKRVDDAVKYFTRGCDLGLPMSCFFLGGLHYRQSEQLEASERSHLRNLAVLRWTKACELGGHEFACRNAAIAYRRGDGVEQDESKANELESLIRTSRSTPTK